MIRFFSGLVAGLALAVLVWEAWFAGLELLTADVSVASRLAEGTALGPQIVAVLLGGWLLASFLGATMAASVSGSRICGWLLGLIFAFGSSLTAALAAFPDLTVVFALATPVAGAWLGTRLASLEMDLAGGDTSR